MNIISEGVVISTSGLKCLHKAVVGLLTPKLSKVGKQRVKRYRCELIANEV